MGGLKGRVTHASLLLCLVLLAASCVTGGRAESFDYWTRYYEVRMGLEQTTEIVFKNPPGGYRCAEVVWEQWVGKEGPHPVLVTYYDPKKSFCRPPWIVALHEACHRRLQHHMLRQEYVNALGIDIEAEADECEGWY